MSSPSKRKNAARTLSLTIDRFEAGRKTTRKTTDTEADDQIAVLLTDDGTPINFPHGLLPDGSEPGDVLTVTFRKDPEATRRIAESTREVQEDLKATDPGGDIRL